jgi:hypothetical protein
MGRYPQACDAFRGGLATALLFNLEAISEVLSLSRPFFPQGWATLPNALDNSGGSIMANNTAFALEHAGEFEEASAAYCAALAADLQSASWPGVRVVLSNLSRTFRAQNRLAQEDRCLVLSLNLATLTDDTEIFRARLDRFEQLATIGQWPEAKAIWDLLDPMGRN